MSKPLVSIVCTVYNKAPWLRETIDSFLKQETDFHYDILLIDDCSTDQSAQILEEYAEGFPDKIRLFKNEENMGIARTWLKICDLVEAPYLARCDGDDAWTNPQKLQLQLDALRKQMDSKWVTTDIDFVDESGQIIGTSIFESHQMPYVHDFETMLATRGFLAPSTWLIETKLMQEINHQIDLNTADDTFDMQLDLFQKTKLTYLPISTVAYRINQGSDSRPKDFEKIEERFNKLLSTQEAYLDKYPDSNYREMLRILLERNNSYELELTRHQAGLAKLGMEKVTIYLDCGQGFRQEDILQYPLANEDDIKFILPENCRCIRVDLSESPSFYKEVRLVSLTYQTEVLPKFTNAIVLGNSYVFPNPDPQMIFDIQTDLYGREMALRYSLFEINDIYSDNYVAKILAQELLDVKHEKERLHQALHQYKAQYDNLTEKVERQRIDLEEVTRVYNSVTHSRRWTIPTKLINFFRRK
ncbi:glycosyltransferase [Streptococcus loxodontisalivarius]|uniref:Glucosyltransferase n=1 Tax=Streptococcus loxodontisalivarius TaxID=1349415 RepID=A0ABS2PSS8_9STRE|nr:glycosyltransferase [Streptococcus loxodontisalivarius]MBM7642427.1 glucosyltransferase [Streptococcus loxodontisalivarius]